MFDQSCEEFRPLISELVDGTISPSDSVALREHLAHCDDCRALVDEYRAIRDQLRNLPVPPPPPDLSRSVRSKTVDKPRLTGLRGRMGMTVARFGLSTAAATAVLLIVAAFAVVLSHQRGTVPSVAGSIPVTGQEWPSNQPIRITFAKPMDEQSVEANLRVWPAEEQDRLPRHWVDSTLVLGNAADGEPATLRSATSYTIMILPDARDRWGNRLGSVWQLSFRTAGGGLAEQPQATAPPSSESTAGHPAAPTSSAASTPSPGGTAPTTADDASPSTAESSPSPPPAGATAPSGSPASTAGTAPPPTPSPTAPSTPPPAAAPGTAPASPSPSPGAPAGTATPSPATGTSPQPATVTPVTGAFGSVYWANDAVAAALGAPRGPEYAVNAAELGFQHGTMYERFDLARIYVLYADGTWESRPDTWTSAEPAGGGPGPSDGLWIPAQGFGKVWNAGASTASRLGYALSETPHYLPDGGLVQEFERGHMLYSDQGFVYVIYDDGTWALYPDTSGHADLETPTPVPSGPTPEPTGDTGGSATPSAPTTPEQTATPDSSGDATATPDAGTNGESAEQSPS